MKKILDLNQESKKISKLKLRSYIIIQEEIIRVGNDSNHRTKFPQMANKKGGILIRVYFKDKPSLDVVNVTTAMVFFNKEGQWDFDPIEEKRLVNVLNNIFSSDISNIMHMPFSPKLGAEQKNMLTKRLKKDLANRKANIQY